MTRFDCLDMAKEIYVRRVSNYAGWDYQKLARECFNMAMQFSLAVQAEQAGSSTDSHSSSQSGTVSPDTSSSSMHPQPGSTTDTPQRSATDSTAAAATGSETAPPAHTDLHPEQSQEQLILGIQQAPFAPYNPGT